MSKILSKKVSNKISRYFLKLSKNLTKPQLRCVREMVIGILKSQSLHINKIASAICDDVSLHQTTKRFRNHYNKETFYEELTQSHLETVSTKVHHGDYILYDGSDIQKKYAKCMEGLDFVKDSDKGTIGLGYWLMNAIHFSKEEIITPLYSKLYSFDHGAKSENFEVQEAIKMLTQSIKKSVINLFDRGFDRPLLRKFILSNVEKFILRLNYNTKLIYKGNELSLKAITKKITLDKTLKATKAGKNGKPYMRTYKAGAVRVQMRVNNEVVDLWLVALQRSNGAYGWLLTSSLCENPENIALEAFKGYGYRWKIEEYHRHIKSQYNLEEIQVFTFEGLKSMIIILTIAMNIIYSEIESLHYLLIKDSGIKTCNKEKLYELFNFVYYKIGTIIKVLFAHLKPRAFKPILQCVDNTGQLKLEFKFD